MATSSSHPTSVLIVDDDEFMGDVLTEALHSLNVTDVRCLTSGKEALRWLRQTPQPPSLLISDIYMPGMDGFEFIQALSDMRYPGKVMLCSGVSLENLALARDVAEGLGLALAGVHSKPLTASVLAQVFKENDL